MSDLETLTAAPRADLLDPFTLSPFTLKMLGQAQAEFKRRFLAAAEGNESLTKAAMLRLELGAFAHGTWAYDKQCLDNLMLPFLVWTAAKPIHPTVKLAEIEAVMPMPRLPGRENPAFAKLQRGVLELMGFPFPAEKPATPGNAPTAPPTGA